jgi:hypothetical protein
MSILAKLAAVREQLKKALDFSIRRAGDPIKTLKIGKPKGKLIRVC